jgi:hypothetical protein
MSRADDLLNNVQKAVGDKPFLLLAGAGDLASEKLRELPDVVSAWQEENRDFPMRAAGALIGAAFRANLKVGELYDELTRRGQDVMTKMHGDDVVAEEDEPFLHEPFMPEPVHRVAAAAPSVSGKVSAATKGAKKTAKSAVKKAVKKSAVKKSAVKKSAVKKSAKNAATKTAKGPAKNRAVKSAARHADGALPPSE